MIPGGLPRGQMEAWGWRIGFDMALNWRRELIGPQVRTNRERMRRIALEEFHKLHPVPEPRTILQLPFIKGFFQGYQRGADLRQIIELHADAIFDLNNRLMTLEEGGAPGGIR